MWLKTRKKLYERVRAQVESRLGAPSSDLLRYEREYEREFRKTWKSSTKKELTQAIENNDVIMIGDFHALLQSQKSQLRILKSLPEKQACLLAVECIESKYQDVLDQYMLGQISEEEFLAKVKWREHWGFPWEQYRSLFEWARKHRWPVFALNKYYKSSKTQALKSRDRWAAKQLADLSLRYPQHKMIVLYGDLHLAQKHIPQMMQKRTKKRLKILRIYQNSEKIYFELLRKGIEGKTDVVKLSRDSFCVLSVPPWVKWQNYLMYLEKSFDVIDIDDELIDYTDHVNQLVILLANELQCSPSEFRDASGFSVYSSEDPMFWRVIQSLSPGEQKILNKIVLGGESMYLPKQQAGLLLRPTVNHASVLAMDFVHSELCHRKHQYWNMPVDFKRQIWQHAVTYFGSKLINHKRKTDTLQDMQKHLVGSGHNGGHNREVLLLALDQKMRELFSLKNLKTSRRVFRPRQKSSYFGAARLLGGMMGERLYNGYRKGRISRTALLKFLKKDIDSNDFDLFYKEMLELAETLPLLFRSKQERL